MTPGQPSAWPGRTRAMPSVRAATAARAQEPTAGARSPDVVRVLPSTIRRYESTWYSVPTTMARSPASVNDASLHLLGPALEVGVTHRATDGARRRAASRRPRGR